MSGNISAKGFLLDFTEMIIGLLYSVHFPSVYQVTFGSIASSPVAACTWPIFSELPLLSHCALQFALNPLKSIQGSFAPH